MLLRKRRLKILNLIKIKHILLQNKPRDRTQVITTSESPLTKHEQIAFYGTTV